MWHPFRVQTVCCFATQGALKRPWAAELHAFGVGTERLETQKLFLTIWFA